MRNLFSNDLGEEKVKSFLLMPTMIVPYRDTISIGLY